MRGLKGHKGEKVSPLRTLPWYYFVFLKQLENKFWPRICGLVQLIKSYVVDKKNVCMKLKLKR